MANRLLTREEMFVENPAREFVELKLEMLVLAGIASAGESLPLADAQIPLPTFVGRVCSDVSQVRLALIAQLLANELARHG